MLSVCDGCVSWFKVGRFCDGSRRLWERPVAAFYAHHLRLAGTALSR